MEFPTGRGRYALFGLLVVIWGLNYLFVKAGLADSAPLWLATLRAGIGALGIAVLLLSPAVRGSLDSRGRRDALLIGVPTTGLFFGLWFLAAGLVLPGVAAVVIYTFPLWVALLSSPVLHQSLGVRAWAAVAGGFAGVTLLAQPWQSSGSPVPLIALFELLGGALCWAIGTVVFQRRFRPTEFPAANVYQMIGGAVTLLAASLAFEYREFPSLSPELTGIVLWLGLVGTALAYAIWYGLLARTRAATLSAYVFLVPIVALVASAIVFDERLAAIQILGVGVVLLSLYFLGTKVSR